MAIKIIYSGGLMAVSVVIFVKAEGIPAFSLSICSC